MRRQLRRLMILSFVLGGLLALAGFRASLPRILILHSGSEGSAWVRGLDLAFERELQASRQPVRVERHYMRLDEPGSSPEVVRVRVQDARRAVDRLSPDMLIAVDDEANNLVARHENGRPDLRRLYVSINQPPSRYGYDGRTSVTGVAETLPLLAIRDAIEALHGVPPFAAGTASHRPLRVAALARDSETGHAELEQVKRFDWAPLQLVEAAAVGDFDQWKRGCESWAGKADIILVLSYRGMPLAAGSTKAVTGAELAGWMETACRPMPIGVSSGYVADGGGLSIAPSPEEYGRISMRMALEWLASDSQAAPPKAQEATHFDVALNATRLRRRGLNLPPLYVEAAHARNAYSD
jgi:hypothetical protein